GRRRNRRRRGCVRLLRILARGGSGHHRPGKRGGGAVRRSPATRQPRLPVRPRNRSANPRLFGEPPAGGRPPRSEPRRDGIGCPVSVWVTLAGGFAGTLVLTIALAGANYLRLTRMDIPFLLGTAWTDDRSRARVVGYALHFVFGLLFSLAYYAAFLALGRS